SAVMTTEMVIEMLEDKKVEMVDCPLVEGAVVASIDAAVGMDFEAIKADLAKVGGTKKF
ncbi:MAG TPA: dihydroxyacetone kinase, partial [Lachnoclostridium sp.]|nr:dihydroxyacetone kinase [Lachnoclostridium sp.]